MKAKISLYIRFGISLILFTLISTPFIFLPRKFHFKFLYPVFEKIYLFASKIRGHIISKKYFKQDGPFIFASNHKCYADFCIIAKYLKTPFSILIKKEMTYNIFFKFIAWKMNLIPVKRGNDPLSQLEAIKKAKRAILNNKYSLIIFPEGYYSFDKPVGELKSGIVKLARETGVKIVPVALYGIKNTFIEEDKLKWKDVYLKFGDAFKYSDYNDNSIFLNELAEKITNLYYEIEKEVKNIENNL